MKSLAIMAGSRVQEKEWQKVKKKYNVAKQEQIDRYRFQQKKRNMPNFQNVLEEILMPEKRIYTRSVLLHKIRLFYQQLYHIVRVRIPRIDRTTQHEFIYRLSFENPKEVFYFSIFDKKNEYTVYYLRTPAIMDRPFPPDTILRVIFFQTSIIDITPFPVIR